MPEGGELEGGAGLLGEGGRGVQRNRLRRAAFCLDLRAAGAGDVPFQFGVLPDSGGVPFFPAPHLANSYFLIERQSVWAAGSGEHAGVDAPHPRSFSAVVLVAFSFAVE